MCALIMEKHIKIRRTYGTKSLLKTTKAPLLSYKGLYFLNLNLVNLLNVYLYCCLNNILTASISPASLKLQKIKKRHPNKRVLLHRKIPYHAIDKQYIDLQQ